MWYNKRSPSFWVLSRQSHMVSDMNSYSETINEWIYEYITDDLKPMLTVFNYILQYKS